MRKIPLIWYVFLRSFFGFGDKVFERKYKKARASPTPPRPAPEGAYRNRGGCEALMLPKNSLKTPAIPIFQN
jgi:hypothetical protein